MAIDSNFELVIDCTRPSTSLFLETIEEYKFPEIKRLHIDFMDKLSDRGINSCNSFLKHASPTKLEALYMYGGEFLKLDLFKEGLESALKAVTGQIYIFRFMIRELIIRGCIIDDLRIGFKLDSEVKYTAIVRQLLIFNA
jgi:hypothetical protein